MDFAVMSELQEHLAAGERLVWTGQPRKGLLFRKSNLFLVPFSLLWFGFSVFWVVVAAKASVFFALFGIPFVAIDLFSPSDVFSLTEIKERKPSTE